MVKRKTAPKPAPEMTVKKVSVVKKKAVFVDGPSASFMRGALKFNPRFSSFFNILTKEIGELETAHTLHTISSLVPHVESLEKKLQTAGFETKILDTDGGQDDEWIKDKILELDPEVIGEIVIVSSDQGYVPRLRKKAAQGIKIYWVATRGIDPRDGRSAISNSLEEIFENGEFEFVDLANFKEKLFFSDWTEKKRAHSIKPASPTGASALKTIKVTLEMTVVPERAPAILHSIGSLMANVSRLDGVVNPKMTTEF